MCFCCAEVVGPQSVKSAARMNGAVVIFLDSIDKVKAVVANRVVSNDAFVPVSPLTQPARKVILSNVPPFIGDEVLERELSRHGKIVSPIKKLPSGCTLPQLSHVVSHRRQVFMVPNNKTEELNLMFKMKVDGFDYTLYVTSESMKCFSCGKEAHLIKACPWGPVAVASPAAPSVASAASAAAAGAAASGSTDDHGSAGPTVSGSTDTHISDPDRAFISGPPEVDQASNIADCGVPCF